MSSVGVGVFEDMAVCTVMSVIVSGRKGRGGEL